MSNVIKGYKAMNGDMTCRDFKFKIGKTYETNDISMCKEGFHFCENFYDVYEYYDKSIDTIVCEIEALGRVLKEGNKSVTNKIKIVKQLTDRELLEFFIKNRNSGDRNSGDWNSGNWNSGDGNSGNRNSGYGNSGDGNSGNWNSGDRNSGNRNSGYGNSGNWNSGYGNSGDRNSGDWNSGDGNSGYFNTTIPIYLFNKPSTMKYSYEFENKIRSLNVKPILSWITSLNMTKEEKLNNPSHIITGGFLRKTNRYDWKQLTNEDKDFILSLPNYDDDIFFQITGVRLLEEKIEVVINGITKLILKKDAKRLGLIE